MSTQSLIQSYPSENVRINNIAIDKFSRPSTFHIQATSPTTTVDVAGSHTAIIQTQPLTTPHDNVTQFKISHLGDASRASWTNGDIVKVHILSYSGFNGVPFISGFKESGTGNYVVDIANVVQTGSPPAAYALNGLIQFSVEYTRFNLP